MNSGHWVCWWRLWLNEYNDDCCGHLRTQRAYLTTTAPRHEGNWLLGPTIWHGGIFKKCNASIPAVPWTTWCSLSLNARCNGIHEIETWPLTRPSASSFRYLYAHRQTGPWTTGLQATSSVWRRASHCNRSIGAWCYWNAPSCLRWCTMVLSNTFCAISHFSWSHDASNTGTPICPMPSSLISLDPPCQPFLPARKSLTSTLCRHKLGRGASVWAWSRMVIPWIWPFWLMIILTTRIWQISYANSLSLNSKLSFKNLNERLPLLHESGSLA